MSHTKEFEHLKIQLEAILSATNNFASENCIGKGGFGKVYKGEIDIHSKGKSMVAFKRLDRTFGQGNPEFWKEIMMLSRYKHENIISLLGFCDESDEKILVYEYASKRSLDLYLSNDDLPWIERLKICTSAAHGLAYLHNPLGTQLRVLHRDIKSSNILLDENWNAKISDFGLSKLGPANHQFTFLVTNAVGTIGYCDPLYVEMGFLTKESDVYSFGVVLFEVLCGRLCVRYNDDKYQPLTRLARECYKKKKINEIIHGSIKGEIDPNSLKLFTRIAYQCLKRDREKRPSMSEIVRILETALEYQCCSAPDQFPSDFPHEVAAAVLPLDGVGNKRRLSPEQVHMLERNFEEENKLEPERKTELAEKLGLDPRQVAVWFQNRRARWKTKTLENDYHRLKTDFDSMVKENEKLKAEVSSTGMLEQGEDEQKDSRRGHSKPERWTSHKDVDFSLVVNSSASLPNVEKTNRYDDTEPMKPVDISSKPQEIVEKSNSKSLVEENDDVKTGEEGKHMDKVEKLKL